MQDQIKERPFTRIIGQLRDVGLRPTRQRMALARILFEGPNRHVTAESLHSEATNASINISLATVYNTLHQFTDVGLLREVVVDSSRTYFDTNVTNHHHYFMESEGCLKDIPMGAINIDLLPDVPKGKKFSRVEVIIHVADEN